MVFLLRKFTCINHLCSLILNFLLMFVSSSKLFMDSNKLLGLGCINLEVFFLLMVSLAPPQIHPCLFIFMVLPLWYYFFMSMISFLLVAPLQSFIISLNSFLINLLWRTCVIFITSSVCMWYEHHSAYFWPNKNMSRILFVSFICTLLSLFVLHLFLEPPWSLRLELLTDPNEYKSMVGVL